MVHVWNEWKSEYTVTDVFQVGLGDVEWVGRVLEAGQDADKDLASTPELHPHYTLYPYLESWDRQREEVETEVDIVADPFWLGWVMWNGTEVGRKWVGMWTRTWLQLLSCTLIAHSVLIWKAESDREKRQKPKLIFRLKLQGYTSRYIY